eukprot:192582-Chlamydomonas_euryale.AAC.3
MPQVRELQNTCCFGEDSSRLIEKNFVQLIEKNLSHLVGKGNEAGSIEAGRNGVGQKGLKLQKTELGRKAWTRLAPGLAWTGSWTGLAAGLGWHLHWAGTWTGLAPGLSWQLDWAGSWTGCCGVK